MAQVVNALTQWYNTIMANADPRAKDWPLTGSPFPMLTIIASYLYFVKVFGPAYMKDRKPFQINGIIVAYNLLMVILSAFFFFYGGSKTYLSGKYNWMCEPVNYSTDEESLLLVNIGWWYLMLKIAEFADTIFFVLRKKFNHISTLHVVHHTSVAWGVWIGLKFGPGGHNAFFPFINCFIHMIMYSYYCLAALGPHMQKYLWWKKYLTQMQMIQFIIATIHAAIPIFYDCGFQPVFAYIIIFHAILFFVMFYNFYRKTYNEELRMKNQSKKFLEEMKKAEELKKNQSAKELKNEQKKVK
ncbi:elongation of very long chain fatty acids protein AAEL008004-like [Stegodyphus dumicola]|uniref:elongation of very long chain fatty acids protein AAEL008004-like n=1 Tax=Stegodyphus dumicola TaxID=202533 RepID=UPI0015ADC83F|nr:elongation of very long chain fatty acids protein AAEL008004-like [Stegodyphus dumicola]